MTHLVGCVVGDSSVFFSRSVLTVEVCECAGVFTLSATRSTFVDGVFEIVSIKGGSYFIDIALPVARLQLNQFFYNPLVIILGFIALDGLRVGCGLRSYYHFPRFIEWDVVLVFDSQYFFFQFPTLTGSCIDGMIASAIRTLIRIVVIVDMVVRILLSTFATYFSTSTIIFVMAVFLTIVATQWIGYELLNSLHCVAYFYPLRYFRLVKCHYVGVCFNEFTLFLIETLFTSVTPCFFISFFISSIVHNDNSLLLTTPLLMFIDL